MARDTHKCWIGLDEKIVHGLKYDTEKASPIASANNLHKGVDSTTDFGYWEATLYITENNRSLQVKVDQRVYFDKQWV